MERGDTEGGDAPSGTQVGVDTRPVVHHSPSGEAFYESSPIKCYFLERLRYPSTKRESCTLEKEEVGTSQTKRGRRSIHEEVRQFSPVTHKGPGSGSTRDTVDDPPKSFPFIFLTEYGCALTSDDPTYSIICTCVRGM